MSQGRKGSIGVIGLGIMGGAFAKHLAAAGWKVFGYDIDPARRKALARLGVQIVNDVKSVAAAAPHILTSLPHPDALAATAEGIAAAQVSPRIIAECSTFTIEDKQRAEKILRKAGHTLLDCPVSGTGAQAAVKDLLIYASGDKAAIRRLRPAFADFSRQTHDLGEFGNGSKMKYVANLLVAIHNVAAAEAMVLGMKAGLDPKHIFEFATGGAGNSRMLEVRGPMMVKGDYSDATMKNYVWQKDMAVIGAFAARLGVPTPLFSATLPVYASAMSTGYAEEDTGAVCAVLEKWAGVRRGRKKKR
ncbi:MAG: NAD(P)-dependent oxidoreductase [Pseudorhodoplanes sp.]|jgi:3-hydroxyisobutyrate dehydrogenase-like beta-hydroxyacid dehydrogenase|nr:NAD(P)-dependent oxidoreductase [Pseudorhodoplanes sp.]